MNIDKHQLFYRMGEDFKKVSSIFHDLEEENMRLINKIKDYEFLIEENKKLHNIIKELREEVYHKIEKERKIKDNLDV